MTVGCLHLPNGNPAPGPKFDYKLRWFGRLAAHAMTLLATDKPIGLAVPSQCVLEFDLAWPPVG
jgi:exodeoxyribonuclease-3